MRKQELGINRAAKDLFQLSAVHEEASQKRSSQLLIFSIEERVADRPYA
jgi:hypothetical protein